MIERAYPDDAFGQGFAGEWRISEQPRKPVIRMNLHRVSKFLETFEARLVEPADIMEAIRAQESRRNDRWTWMTKYQDEELPRWINDTDTLVFEITLASLKGVKSLDFAQQVWMLQPSLFEWQSWESREFDRIWWDPDARLRRRAPGGDTDA